jgi:hypothetical protein
MFGFRAQIAFLANAASPLRSFRIAPLSEIQMLPAHSSAFGLPSSTLHLAMIYVRAVWKVVRAVHAAKQLIHVARFERGAAGV